MSNTEDGRLLIKWVGEPDYVCEDGFTVYDWKHENKRTVALVGFAYLSCPAKNFPGLSQDYMWGRPKVKARSGGWRWGNTALATVEDFIQSVDPLDWQILQKSDRLRAQLKDVTGHANPIEVLKDTIIVKQDPDKGQWFRVLKQQ